MGCTQNKTKATSTSLPCTPQSVQDIRSKYSFVRVIGKGHCGTVRLATLTSRPTDLVAVKTMVKHPSSASYDLLHREIRILFSLDHPNIIRLIEVFEDDKYVHLVTEYCSGGELLDHLMTFGRYSEQQTARLVGKILLAVKNLHLNNVCHRDLKPDNFMFEDETETAELKLIDFGLASKFLRCGKGEMHSFVGTPDYVAPEVLQGRYGPECDLWSVGVIMYVLLSGKLPFSSPALNRTYSKILSGSFSTTSDTWSQISPFAIDLLKKLLVIDPSQRLTAESALKHPWFSQSPSLPLPISPDLLRSLKSYRVRSKLQSETYAAIAKRINFTCIKDIKDTFLALDTDKKGFLSFDQVEKELIKAGIDLKTQEIEEIRKNTDFKGDGRINYSEFVAATLECRALLNENVILSAFTMFDVDNTGYITVSNVKEALKRAGREVEDQEVKEMMKEVGGADYGIDYETFKKLVGKDSL